MGSIVAARCPCGFDAQLFLGAGEASHRTSCTFPVFCPACERLSAANFLARKVRCDQCGGEVVPYDDPSLAGEPGKRTAFSWNLRREVGRTLRLSNGTYRCPACRETRLTFVQTGIFD